jgi:transposase
MDGVVEIITGRERRRRWGTEEKRRIVEESMEPGAAMRAVAARNGICESEVDPIGWTGTGVT